MGVFVIVESPPSAPTPADLPADPVNASAPQPDPLIHWSRSFTSAKDEAAIRAAIARIHEELWPMPADELDALVRRYWDGGDATLTGLTFGIGNDGFITAPSNLRVVLLDALTRLAPDEAAAFGREWLPKVTDHDEWATLLRAVAFLIPSGDQSDEFHPFLVEQVRRRLQDPAWLAQPGAGFLEAFDAASHLADGMIYNDMAGILHQRGASESARNAALLALQEVAQNQPYRFVGHILAEPDFLAADPALRGTLLASADVRTREMTAALEEYFLESELPTEELHAFALSFPRREWSSGARLLTSTRHVAIPATDLPAQYQAAAALLEQIARVRTDLDDDTLALLEKRAAFARSLADEAFQGLTE